MLRFVTAGSVDDGKSTLIGRLLHDKELIPSDVLQGLTDLAYLTDGLRDEREQKITIDVAYRYFEIQGRKFILADTPGHEQYTRNMLTGASTADLAVILVDARKGVTSQTRRHTLLCSLLGVPQIVLAVNKMDTVEFQQNVFQRIEQDFYDYADRLKIASIVTIPVSALEGDNIVHKSAHMEWYDGPTLLHHLQHVHLGSLLNQVDFRLAVQCVVRPHQDFRGLAGRVLSGRIRPGQQVTLLPAETTTTIRTILGPGGELDEAVAGQSVLLTLQDEREAARGTMVARTANQPERATRLDVNLCWTDARPLQVHTPYWLLHTSRKIRCQVEHVHYQLDVDSLHRQPAQTLELNQIGRVRLVCSEAVFFDPYDRNRETGSLALVDPQSHHTVAAGMIRGAALDPEKDQRIYPYQASIDRVQREQRQGHLACVLWFTGLSGSGKSTLAQELEKLLFAQNCNTFSLDGDNLRHGLNSDLPFSQAARKENVRRAAEVARLAFEHGHIVLASFISPFAEDRQQARQRIEPGRFLEIFLDCPLEECLRRDPKGLYARAQRGEIPEFTGISSPYEKPQNPELHLPLQPLERSLQQLLDLLKIRHILPPS
ncbi:MAG: adenylyl-sulfate kinase [Candidatus Eremiobacteraeota bacterium]|nr:adenylyl-sulfate kinase [Candidatus Eremiobacteraeota bacterium]MCW5866652.1 adenylyl-sulfate kinase [Candidatus Eremiobacteraeota bacterium]